MVQITACCWEVRRGAGGGSEGKLTQLGWQAAAQVNDGGVGIRQTRPHLDQDVGSIQVAMAPSSAMHLLDCLHSI